MRDTMDLPPTVRQGLAGLCRGAGELVVLTGAGISAESGIPTFRGKDGFWTVGSREYQPQQMATREMFAREPEAVWAWYLYRRALCRAAEPNEGHLALVELEGMLQERFLLITQNVDGLHLRAGTTPGRLYQIHGNLHLARCVAGCGYPIWDLPAALVLGGTVRRTSLDEAERAALRCPGCGEWARPHVLWFDESYDDDNYHLSASLDAVRRAAMLLVVGTTGATNLPMQLGLSALRQGATIVDVNPAPNVFSELAQQAPGGAYLRGAAGSVLPRLVQEARRCSSER